MTRRHRPPRPPDPPAPVVFSDDQAAVVAPPGPVRDDAGPTPAGMVDVPAGERVETRTALVSVTCAWCGTVVPYTGTGRRPKWCGRSCRQRAYEARTADRRTTAATIPQRDPVREVVRETEVRTRVVVRCAAPPPPAPLVPRTARQWTDLLALLGTQLRDDRSPLHKEHWRHRRLQAALLDACTALDSAHPGGLPTPR